jgi:putative exporter of polyketide antibiotics
LKYSEFGFVELLFVLFLYLLTVLNTLPTVIDNISPFGYRKRQNFQDIKNFPIRSFRVGMKK